jgi:hypothetical protein
MDNNILREQIEMIGMNPDGALIGAIGAIIAVIWKVNGYGFKSSIVIIVGGFCLCGYLYQSLAEHWPLPIATVYLIVFIIGFVSNHVYRFLDASAPKVLALGLDYISKWIKKKP